MYPEEMQAKQKVSPAQDIMRSLFDNYPPFEIIGVIKECENIFIDYLMKVSEETEKIAASNRVILDEAKAAFLGQPLPLQPSEIKRFS